MISLLPKGKTKLTSNQPRSLSLYHKFEPQIKEEKLGR